MKIKLLSCLCLLNVIIITKSQTYYPFPTKNATWAEVFYKPYPDYGTLFHFFKLKNNDTIINGKVYYKLYHSTDTLIQEDDLCGGIREENKKIFYYSIKPIQISNESQCMFIAKDTEVLLYDFSLRIGDTIKNGLYRISYPDSLVLSNIDSVLINDSYRKRFKFKHPSSDSATWYMEWIEGIGYLRGLLFPNGAIPTNGLWNDVICFTHNDTIIYQNPNYSNCYNKNSDLIINSNEFDIILYPNPILSRSTLSFPKDQFKKVVLYNIFGSVIKEYNIVDQNSITIQKEAIPYGVYIIRLIGSKNSSTIKALIN